MDIRCGDCATLLPAGATQCPACGRVLGTKPRAKRPTLLIWAAVAAAAEVALTLVIMRSCR